MSEVSSDSEVFDCQHIEDLDSCLGYLKKREVFLYKMMNDPNHKAMLYFLEVLLNGDRQQTIEDLTGKFFCKNFTDDMRTACGNSSADLKTFLARYPSLFQVVGNKVSAVAMEIGNSVSTVSNCSSPSLTNTSRVSTNGLTSTLEFSADIDSNGSKKSNSLNSCLRNVDVSSEWEAVKFFQNKLLKRDEKWILIKSLAGHLSQATDNIRKIVGPQLEFKTFLCRHPHVFEIQGELVSLKENFSRNSSARKSKLNVDPMPSFNGIKPSAKVSRPKSLNISESAIQGANSFGPISAPSTPVAHSNSQHVLAQSAPLSMTGNEYRAIMFLRKVIEKKNGSLSLSHLFLYLGKASESVRNVIGWTRFELQEFIRKNFIFFDMTPNEMILNRKANRINVIITATNNSSDSGSMALTNRRGKVFHVAKLWGIIDLGKHEHVFFDKSIFKHLDDLQRHFKIGECLYFNAILAPKESRAKWRATHVWKESDRDMVERFSGNILGRQEPLYGRVNDADFISDCNSIITDISDHINPDDSIYSSDDQRTLPDDIEREIAKILNSAKSDDEYEEDLSLSNMEKWYKRDTLINFSNPFKTNPGILYSGDSDPDDESIGSIPTPDLSSHQSIQSDPSIASHPLSAPAANSAHYTTVPLNDTLKKNSDLSKISNGEPSETSQKSVAAQNKRPQMVNTASQTLSTGDIMATNLFHEGVKDVII